MIENNVIHLFPLAANTKTRREKTCKKEKEINLHGPDRATCEFLCDPNSAIGNVMRLVQINSMRAKQQLNGANVIRLTDKNILLASFFSSVAFVLFSQAHSKRNAELRTYYKHTKTQEIVDSHKHRCIHWPTSCFGRFLYTYIQTPKLCAKKQ